MVDADSTVGLLPIQAAVEVKKRYADQIHFEIGVQPLQGVLDPASYEQYAEACAMADYCGGLPSRDRPRPEAHLDIILDLAQAPRTSRSTCMWIRRTTRSKTRPNCSPRRPSSTACRAASSASTRSPSARRSEREQDRIIAKILEADMGIVICPSAALSMASCR